MINQGSIGAPQVFDEDIDESLHELVWDQVYPRVCTTDGFFIDNNIAIR
jgi:hypothetical protein